MPILVNLIGELRDIASDLGDQRRSQRLPGAVADKLIEQRPARTGVVVGLIDIVN